MVREALRGLRGGAALNPEERRQRELVDALRVATGHLSQIAAKGRAAFTDRSNWSDRAAATHEVVVLAEAAKKLGEPFHKNNEGIPWEALKKLRGRIVHYLDADARPVGDEELWKFIAEDVPRIDRRLRRPVFREGDDPDLRDE